MRLRLDTGAPRILGKQQKAQETEFRHPEAVAFFARFDGQGGSAADSAGDRQHRSPDIRARGEGHRLLHGRHPTSEDRGASETDAMSHSK